MTARGLNLQVYNRCIGTRTCQSYCPYKVRRFNFLDYTGGMAPVEQQQRNPEVSVRARGVMEKCTYCSSASRAPASTRPRTRTPPSPTAPWRPPARAPARPAPSCSATSRMREAGGARARDPRNYALLGELNTRPRTTYLASLAPAPTPAGRAEAPWRAPSPPVSRPGPAPIPDGRSPPAPCTTRWGGAVDRLRGRLRAARPVPRGDPVSSRHRNRHLEQQQRRRLGPRHRIYTTGGSASPAAASWWPGPCASRTRPGGGASAASPRPTPCSAPSRRGCTRSSTSGGRWFFYWNCPTRTRSACGRAIPLAPGLGRRRHRRFPRGRGEPLVYRAAADLATLRDRAIRRGSVSSPSGPGAPAAGPV